MKLIDRYVIEVGKRLPLLKGRKDIENELRSTLEDMLEDRAGKAGRPADEAMEIELLGEYGSPNQVAMTYNPMPYLIGPRMFPFFIMVLKIVLTVLTIVLLVMTGIEIATQPPATAIEFFNMFGKGLLEIIGGAISAFGNIVLVFAIIERFVPDPNFVTEDQKEWQPASLLKEPRADEVKPWEPIAGIVFTFIAISIFNFYPQLIGIYTFDGSKWTVIPVLSDAFFRWMPLINATWVFSIFVDGLLLRSARWTRSTRILALMMKIMMLVIGYLLISGPTITTVTPEVLRSTGIFDADSAQDLGALIQQGLRGLIALIMFLQAVDVVKTTYQLVTQRDSSK